MSEIVIEKDLVIYIDRIPRLPTHPAKARERLVKIPEIDSIFELDIANLPSLNGYKFSTNGNQHADICYENLITEDDEPVDNIPSEKLQRLLVNALDNSDHLPRPFLATANVGLFDDAGRPAIVPDMLLSMGVKIEGDLWEKENRSYFTWKFGKPPEVVLEIVSNTKGNEAGTKFGRYATLGVKYYVIVDYAHRIQDQTINVYELEDEQYILRNDNLLPELDLSLTLWEGEFEGYTIPWVRWCTSDGDMLLTGKEGKIVERDRADQAEQLAARERERVAEERDRAEQAEQLAAKERVRVAEEQERSAQVQELVEQERERAEQAEQLAARERERVAEERDRAAQAQELVEQERVRAEQAEQLAAKERARVALAQQQAAEDAARAELYLQKLREAGIEI